MNYTANSIFPAIAYRKYGTGPALMLVHGFPGDGDLWRLVVPKLSAHFKLLVPDLPGSGESRLGSEPLTMENMAEALMSILQQEQIGKVIVAGHSMGGYVALAFAEQYPQVLNGIVMVHSVATPDDEQKKEVRKKSIKLIQKGGREIFIRQMIPNLFAQTTIAEHAKLIEEQVAEALKVTSEGLVSFYRAMMQRPDRQQVLINSVCPIGWIIGENDTVLSFNTQIQQSHLSNVSSISVYGNCGHMSMLENSVQLSADIIKFADFCSAKLA